MKLKAMHVSYTEDNKMYLKITRNITEKKPKDDYNNEWEWTYNEIRDKLKKSNTGFCYHKWGYWYMEPDFDNNLALELIRQQLLEEAEKYFETAKSTYTRNLTNALNMKFGK